MNEELTNIYNNAKRAIADDLKQNFYDAAQARNQAFRKLNNQANARHALFSGAPAAAQQSYDQSTFLPNTATLAVKAIEKQKENQENWDKYMDYIKDLNEQADYYNNLASELQSKTSNLG